MAGKDQGKVGEDGSTDGWAGIEERLEKIRESLRNPSAPHSRRVQACDRALRACVAELARPGGLVAHGAQLLALAQEATQLYLSLVPEPPHLYLEKILFHVLRNAAGWVGPHTWSVAELLRARLRRGHRHGDWATVASSAFGVLWRAAAALAGPERPREEGRAVLTARIRALRFLLLLESRDGERPPRESFQPPFLTSQTAQSAAAAAALYEAQRAPCPLFLARQLRELLLDALRDEAPQPPGLQHSLCFLELTLERCRHLCKARRHRDALDALEESRTFLGAGNSLGAPLELLGAGIRLSRALAKGGGGVGAVGPALRRAGAALAAEFSGRILRVLVESSQFVLAQLGEVLRRGQELPLGLQELPGICAFCQGHWRALRRLLAQVPPDSIQEQVMVKQLLFHSLQLFSNAIHEIFQRSQAWIRIPGGLGAPPVGCGAGILPSGWPELAQVTTSCVQSVTWMLEGLEGLPEAERGKFLDVTAAATFRLGQALQSRNVPEAAGAVCEPLCRAVLAGHGYGWPRVTPERLHRCFRLQVESWRCRGQPERALDAVAQWLLPIPGRPGSLVAEPVALWARIKTEAAKQGAEELRLRTLRDALESQSRSHPQPLSGDTVLLLLLAELQAYKSLRGPTGPERYNVLCDLLGLWDPEGAWDPPGFQDPGGSRDPPGMPDPGRSLPRAAALLELGQLLCSQSFSAHTDCSALDAVQEALRLLESLSRNSQSCNSQIRDQLLDERAQALLWLHICTLEALVEKSVARERRGQGRAAGPGSDQDPEGERPEPWDGIRCSLSSDSALSKPLDEAFSLWKKLLENPGIPEVRSPEQTVSSLQLLAALYRLQDKPIQALESFLLLRSLCRRLGDPLGTANSLSQLSRILLQLQCPAQAQVFLEELESCLGQDQGPEDSWLLLRHARLLLRSQLCCLQKKAKTRISPQKNRDCWGGGFGAHPPRSQIPFFPIFSPFFQADQGVALLLEALKEPQAQRATRSWYLAQAQGLQLVATFLELPPALLEAPLREQIRRHGWSSPKVALLEAQKLLRSVLVFLLGSDILGSARSRPHEEPGPDCGPALVLKWQVLGDALGCCQRLVTLLGHCEVLCRARAFCSEGLTMAGHLQAARWCTWFLVLQSQLELQQGELELSQSHLQHAQFLLQPQTEPKPRCEPQRRAKIQLRKGHLERRKPLDPTPDPIPGREEDEEFLKGPSLDVLAPAALPEQPDALTASPELKGRKVWKSLEFLSHPSGCPCSFCSDPALVALGLRWLLAQARAWLVAGEVAPGLALVRRVLPRCASAGTRLAREAWGRVPGVGLGNGDIPGNGDTFRDRGTPGNGDRNLSEPSGNGDTSRDRGTPGNGDRNLPDPSGNGDTFRDRDIPGNGDISRDIPGNGDTFRDRDVPGNGDTFRDRDIPRNRDRNLPDPSGNGDTSRDRGIPGHGDIRDGDRNLPDPSGDGDIPGDRDLQDPSGIRDLQGHPGNGDTFGDRDPAGDSAPSPPGPLAELVATGYCTLALQSLASPSQCHPTWGEELEQGLSLLGSQRPPVAGLGVAVATLLLAKAVATLGRVAAALGHSMDSILAQAWTPCAPPTPNPPKPEKNPKAPPKARPQKAKVPRAKAGKTPKVKPPKFGDVFALGDSDPEVAPIVLRPGGACTPHPKSGAPPKVLLGGPRTPFTIFSEESSPPGGNPRLHRAPKIPGRVKSRIRVTFSDSDPEEPQIPPDPPRTTRKNSCAQRRVQPQKSPGNSPGIGARPRRGRPRKELGTPKKRQKGGINYVENLEKKENGIPQTALEKRERRGSPKMENVGKSRDPKMENLEKKEKGKPQKSLEKKENRGPRRAGGPREKKERGTPQSGILEEKRNWEFSGIEERDPLRAVEEEEEEEEMSFELPPLPPGGASEEMPGIGDKRDPPNPEGSRPSAQPGDPSLDTVRSLLGEALAWIGHFPPGSLYGQLCQLLAMALGDRDPLATAGLLAESLSVTMRHQLLAIVHARARKKRKAAAGGDISDQLQGLSLDSQDSQDSQSHLAELEELFQFSSTGLGPAEWERFREQLQKIPSGVTVCQLSLGSATPGALGDTLLLTRLERGAEPVSVRIATERCQAPLSGILREFERIQREQREANACTERQEWWERRSHLDLRMQSLIQSLDSEVLGCWRGLLLPRDPGNSVLEEQELARLLQELRECGWERPEPALLRALLAVLCPADVRPLAAALCPSRPLRARLLLDEALERRREGPGGSAGSLVLLLDGHLQRLPWESSGTLRNVPVTRLPGLRFLLRYGLARQHSGSVLSRGVNPKNAFYVLNPQRDLGGTEERFRGWFESQPGWRGVSGAAPSPQQLQEALGERDLYIYAGHGAGARLLDGHSLARLPCRAVALLFGCSSAALAPRGPLEPSGTVLKFILAGCPLVLGTLWDVTDRDLDRLARALLQGWLGGGPGTPLLAQLAQARAAPRLKSLIGAAPVAYGLPVSLC
ncbi:separin [Anomalospiza imberbis]|uniref:separin n=1 Tax=Anomalospiza imberbis TaxID=187417 RepID=UPI00358E0D3E